MRICHVITRLIIGGAQENTLLTCEGLHDRGHDVLLLAGSDTGPEGSLWNRATAYGYRTDAINSMHRAILPWSEWRTVRELRQAYDQFNPDIIHTHSSKAGILGRFAARSLPNCAIVHTIHGMSFNRTQPAWIRHIYAGLEQHAARYTSRIVSVADAMTDQSVAAGIAPRDRFTTIHSGMTTEWFTPNEDKRRAARRKWGADDEHIVVGTVARLFRNKGYEQLIPAMADAAAKDERLRFVWIGDGADRESYLEQLSHIGLRDRVTLTGLLPPDEVADNMQGFDMLVHCSQWEGLPRTVVQALLLEIPTVSFAIDGAPEVVIDGETGKLVPLNDIPVLSQAILHLAGHPQDRRSMGRAGRVRCLAMFDHHHMVDRLEGLYGELLDSSR
ncbi:MAG: glycosyltransferase family 4 protein [Planctomycetes bacterium]|nr:glycosyltransferase family 4 protein [Planctomycetota bacterium]